MAYMFSGEECSDIVTFHFVHVTIDLLPAVDNIQVISATTLLYKEVTKNRKQTRKPNMQGLRLNSFRIVINVQLHSYIQKT